MMNIVASYNRRWSSMDDVVDGALIVAEEQTAFVIVERETVP